MHPATQHLLDQFRFDHLRSDHLQTISKHFHDLAHDLVSALSEGPELSVALRKLLESKDCAVRQAVLDAQPKES